MSNSIRLIISILILFVSALNASGETVFSSSQKIQDGMLEQTIWINGDKLVIEEKYDRPCRYNHQFGYKKVEVAIKTIGEIEILSGHRGKAIYLHPKKRFSLAGIRGGLEIKRQASDCIGRPIAVPDLSNELIGVEYERADELFNFISNALK